MAKTHYFINQGGISNQSAIQSFGPVSANEFRITNSFMVSAGQKAYAICKGRILVQPQTGSSDRVNLILCPYTQPLPGINIKYFIYRGLRRADFFTSGSTANIIPVANASDFVQKIWADFNNFYSGSNIPTFSAKFIGYDEADPGSTLLSDYFFKQSAGSSSSETFPFELPMLDTGKMLGQFDAGECGIEVVLNFGDYKHDFDNNEFIFDLTYARAAQCTINLPGNTFDAKQKKEHIFQFIDIAAFYGSFVNDGTIIVDNGSGTKTNVTGTSIYNDLLTPFYTKNRWYIYLQSDRNRSYNFYGNYISDPQLNTNIKIGTNENALGASVYQTNGWPIWIDESSQQSVDGNNRLYLQLITDHNTGTVLYGQVGTIENAQRNNFSTIEFLGRNDISEKWTRAITLSTPAINIGSQYKNIAAFSLLIYQGAVYNFISGEEEDENSVVHNIYSQPNFFDDVFDLIKASSLMRSEDSEHFSKMTSERLKLLSVYNDNKRSGVAAVQTVRINDRIQGDDAEEPMLQRVTYITETVQVLNTPNSLNGTISSDYKNSPSGAGDLDSPTYTLPAPFYYERKLFSDSSQTITGLLLKTTDGSNPFKIILGMSATENDTLKSLITVDHKNPRLFLIDLFLEGKDLVSTEKVIYQKYKAGLVVEDANGNLSLLMPENDLIVYSIDRLFHFTKVYSDNMPNVSIEFNSSINQIFEL